MSVWACPRCHALEHPGPRRCSCGEMTVRVEVGPAPMPDTPAPRREDAAGEREQQRAKECIEAGCIWYQHATGLSNDVTRLSVALSTAERERSVPAVPSAEQLAAKFHDTYELLAPRHGYETRKASAKPWSEVPEPNKSLMILRGRSADLVITPRPVGWRDMRQQFRWD